MGTCVWGGRASLELSRTVIEQYYSDNINSKKDKDCVFTFYIHFLDTLLLVLVIIIAEPISQYTPSVVKGFIARTG